MSTLLDRELLFVTGKGGVGKSTVACGLALAAADSGKRVLLCEFDAKGDLLASFAGAGTPGGRQAKPIGFQAREIHERVYAMAMDPEESLKEYLRINLKIPLITKIGALSTAFDFLANAAPGIREIVTVGKVTYETRMRNYDLVVVDATASGHIIGQLRAPQAINELVGIGNIRSQTGWMLDVLGDPARTGVVITTAAQEMPVRETVELIAKITTQTNVDIAGIVVNRVLPEPFVSEDYKRLQVFTKNREAYRAFSGTFHDAAAADVLIEAAHFASSRRRDEAAQLTELARETASFGSPTAFVPMLFSAEPGFDMTRQVCDHLIDEWSL